MRGRHCRSCGSEGQSSQYLEIPEGSSTEVIMKRIRKNEIVQERDAGSEAWQGDATDSMHNDLSWPGPPEARLLVGQSEFL